MSDISPSFFGKLSGYLSLTPEAISIYDTHVIPILLFA
jgi:hypothetical protein